MSNKFGHLYVKVREDGYVKIGSSLDPSKRCIQAADWPERLPELPAAAFAPKKPLHFDVLVLYNQACVEFELLEYLTKESFCVFTQQEVHAHRQSIGKFGLCFRPRGAEFFKPSLTEKKLLSALAHVVKDIPSGERARQYVDLMRARDSVEEAKSLKMQLNAANVRIDVLETALRTAGASVPRDSRRSRKTAGEGGTAASVAEDDLQEKERLLQEKEKALQEMEKTLQERETRLQERERRLQGETASSSTDRATQYMQAYVDSQGQVFHSQNFGCQGGTMQAVTIKADISSQKPVIVKASSSTPSPSSASIVTRLEEWRKKQKDTMTPAEWKAWNKRYHRQSSRVRATLEQAGRQGLELETAHTDHMLHWAAGDRMHWAAGQYEWQGAEAALAKDAVVINGAVDNGALVDNAAVDNAAVDTVSAAVVDNSAVDNGAVVDNAAVDNGAVATVPAAIVDHATDNGAEGMTPEGMTPGTPHSILPSKRGGPHVDFDSLEDGAQPRAVRPCITQEESKQDLADLLLSSQTLRYVPGTVPVDDSPLVGDVVTVAADQTTTQDFPGAPVMSQLERPPTSVEAGHVLEEPKSKGRSVGHAAALAVAASETALANYRTREDDVPASNPQQFEAELWAVADDALDKALEAVDAAMKNSGTEATRRKWTGAHANLRRERQLHYGLNPEETDEPDEPEEGIARGLNESANLRGWDTKWGRCWKCKYARKIVVPRSGPGRGHAHMGCSRFPNECDGSLERVPFDLWHHLPLKMQGTLARV